MIKYKSNVYSSPRQADAEITPEMAFAGGRIIQDYMSDRCVLEYTAAALASEIYLAMLAVSDATVISTLPLQVQRHAKADARHAAEAAQAETEAG